LKELDTEKASVDKLAGAWKSGDAPMVEQIVLKDLKSDPVMYQRLLVERNRNWLPKIDALFSRRGHAFVVVGAAHLVGPDGLLQMLKTKGYAIEQL
ncbi:MAG TPA: TraB/GumN family protein, partial [Casimicrobiaceae bacterium]